MSAAPPGERLTELARRYGLGIREVAQLERLLRILWREEGAPTSVRAPEQALETHLADSLIALELAPVRSARTIVDLGSGAGFPGLALAVALPSSDAHLLESQRRKCAYLQAVVAELGLANAHVVHARAEEWNGGRQRNDVALARALAPAPVVLEYAAPLLRRGGVLVDWRGRRSPREERHALRAAAELGLKLQEIRHVLPFPAARDRHLHVYVKVAETPSRFPRRAGVARKRPLAG
jgi:16S rRNA (guanine527-N7)-methyltransferase